MTCTDEVSARAGLYPMLADDTCRLLACDYDGAQWQLNAKAYVSGS
ncbi:TOTE conflict system archaeo-eukaryotic primase domain-containing protein [Micromonospora sp. DR5-3]